MVSPISDKAWESINNILQERTFKKGEYFARSGRIENTFGIVSEGILKAFITDTHGNEYTKTIFTPTTFTTPVSFIGAYSALVTKTINHVDIQSITNSKIYIGDYYDWQSLYKIHPEIETWSRRMSELFVVNKEIKEFEFFQLQAKERYLLFKKRFPELELMIPQYHIANYLGITPTQLSRIRKKLQDKK